jgi:predicted nucleotidyltransferase component of viral defense system
MRIIEILNEFTKEIEKNNPFGLVLKGGTALSLYYLNHHRESEDLDFDADLKMKSRITDIENYIICILKKLKERGTISDYRIGKKGFASTERYHMKLELITHKTYYSKLDIDFVKLPEKLKNAGELKLYLPERIFISKIVTFIDRQELKDLYDVGFLIDKIDPNIFKKEVIELLARFIELLEKEELQKEFRFALRNTDLRFKHLNEAEIKQFAEKTKKEVQLLMNKVRKPK